MKSYLVGYTANTSTYYIGNHTEYETQALITTLRRYFYAGTTRVAMRVVDGATNPTYWLLNDHLGSTAITANSTGVKTAELRFKAWGEQRYASGSTPTTYRYTGQREQSQLSIYFYGARWYDPQLSRFLSPDTIIPGAGNSQAWDRFAYALNSPIRFIDPTGHASATPTFNYDADFTGNQFYGISFKETKGKWSLKNMLSVLDAAKKVGQKMSKYLGGSAVDAFRKTFGIQGSTRFTFEWDTECSDCRPKSCGDDSSSPGCTPAFGYTAGPRHIKFASMSSRDLSRENNAIHEFMHAFENVIIQTGPDGKPYKPARNALPNDLWTTRDGLAGGGYQQSGDLTDGEVFADMGVGWVQSAWETGADGSITPMGEIRRDWMNYNMPIFIDLIP